AGKAFSGIAVSLVTEGVGAGVAMVRAARLAKRIERAERAASTAAKVCSEGACSIVGRCFVAGTLVATASGPVAIEKIRPGELVLSRDPETGQQDYRPVVRIFVTIGQPTRKIVVRDADGVESAIEATVDHPFWNPGRGWVEAADLVTGDEI